MKKYIIKSEHGIRIGRDLTYEVILEGNDIEIRDEYHSMEELYNHRRALNAALCNNLAPLWNDAQNYPLIAKSKLHDDGSMFEGYFIVFIETQNGIVSYHYSIKHWDEFKIPEVGKAPKYDGHTSQDVIDRLLKL